MNFLQERIIKDGIVKSDQVLKVDSFLNHQIDVELMDMMGAEFKKRFYGKPINKILTIEASGIAIACITARYFHVPVVFAKKTQTIVQDDDKYCADVESFTHKCLNHVFVTKKYIQPTDHILIIDDFMALGYAVGGLVDIVNQAKAELVGIGIVVEKGFQGGGDKFRKNKDIKYKALAVVDGVKDGQIVFRDND